MQWIEALINISALVGFVGVANLGRNIRASDFDRNQAADSEF
jgi:hypothetical protein